MHAAFAIKADEKHTSRPHAGPKSPSHPFPKSEYGAGAGLPVFLQAKLTVNRPGGPDEEEADRVADQVMRMPESTVQWQRVTSPPGIPGPQVATEQIHRKASSPHTVEASPGVSAQIASLRGGGQPLPASTRAFFEPRFGTDLRRVRVHTDDRAAVTAHAIHARAFTTGQDMVFGAGQFAPESNAGKQLLAHELTHVVQQGTGGVAHTYIARDMYDTIEAELQAEEEIQHKKWNTAYGKNPAQQYAAERGSIDEDVTFIGKDRKVHTRHQPALGAASDVVSPDGKKGTKMDMSKGITDADVQTVMTDEGYGDKDLAEIKQAATGAGARITEAFTVMQIDTLEAQALYLAHAAVESRGLRSMTAQADPAVVGQFPGRGPLQVTFQQQYVKALAYLDAQAKRLDGQGKKDEADKARAASAAVKANPAAAADPQYAFIFSAAFMHASGGVQAAAEMRDKSANFGGTGPEDRWETGGANFDERIAHWTVQKQQNDPAADERLRYWTGVKSAGQRKAKAYGRAVSVLRKNVVPATATP